MKQILLFFALAIVVSSCTKKVAMAAFAPSSVTTDEMSAPVSIGEKPRILTELIPANSTDQTVSHHVQQNSIEVHLSAVADSKAQQESVAMHVDRILDRAPVKSYVQKASFKNLKAAPRGAGNWAPQLKIGLTLLAIGIVLAVFGLGFVGGLAALIGLLFTIVGLLVTY
jgi:hypothetical protein